MNDEKDTIRETKEESLSELKARKAIIEKRIHSFRFQPWILITLLIAGGLFGYALASLYSDKVLSVNKTISYTIFGSLAGVFLYLYFTIPFRYMSQNSLRSVEFKLAQLGAEELKDNIEDNFFTKLVQINFKYLDQYYLQTQEQAEKSFRLATFASISGFVIIIIGIVMMYTNSTEPAYVTTGAGVISQFISAIFFFLYNRTILKMSQYHQKLVITQNISLALKMTDDMDKESKTKNLELIIDRLTLDVNKYLTNDYK